ncbi:MAG: T9SS type A sorting domain-containing protein [Candidatus Cloacimonetes bacterium]|nr:T9SS type A sorting domain-containing protein [Candidatus Cloacimonadota bacterium]
MKNAVLLMLLLIVCILQGTLIVVDIEGGGDFTSIQEGIDASVDGDTVLVYPGRYFENTDFNGKSIAVGSLEMTTSNRDFIHSTIIDGNQTGCCVAVHNDEDEGTILRGFTITNGIGYPDPYGRFGGGIYSYETSLTLMNCIIEYNEAEIGGGILIDGGQVSLEGNTFRYNDAELFGGGMMSWRLATDLTFSDDNRNNFYYNHAITGNDIFNSLESGGSPTDILVDTFTVTEPFGYEFYQGEYNYDNQNYETRFEMFHSMKDRIYEDVYINPEGNDENSGLSSDEPFQTLNQALHFVTADEDNPLTIHLSDGIYSTELNIQKFPITLRSYVSVIGESVENTVIELDGIDQGFAIDMSSDLGYTVKNLTIQDGYANDSVHIYNRIFHIINYFPHSDNQVLLENLQILSNNYNRLMCVSRTNMIMRNVSFGNNIHYPNGVSLHNLMSYCNFDCTVLMENCRINNSQSGYLHLDAAMNNQENHAFNIVNCEFTNNNFYNNYTNYSMGISLFAHDDQKINIVNSTFAGNIFDGIFVENAPFKFEYGLDVEIVNSIIYDNETSNSIILVGDPSNGIPIVNVHHSIIEDGLEGVLSDDYCILNWDEDTISETEPLFMYEGEYPYKLQEGSPAIDAGSLDLPEGVVLPEYDLAGNLRIRGNGIDIGAYEYNPYGNTNDENVIAVNNDLLVYPNPLHNSMRSGKANILWQGDNGGEEISFDIFNIKGQRLRELKIENEKLKMNSSVWDLCDEGGDVVSSGVYFVRVKAGGEYVAQRKLTVVK